MPQYYPKSQITPNLYTNGDEFFLKNTQIPYTGYYYKLSTGKRYTGKNPDGGIGIELTSNTTLGGNPVDPISIVETNFIRNTENLSDFDEDLARSKYPKIYEKKKDKSLQLGKKILDQLKRDPYTHLHKKRVEYADFRVLKSLDIPSVLIESGFISNSEDAERLKGKPGRRMIARSLFLGINNYFRENLEDDFFIYDSEGYLTYTVQKGDVLSEIAIRFGVPVMDIINTNLIRDEAIFPGQRIKIKI